MVSGGCGLKYDLAPSKWRLHMHKKKTAKPDNPEQFARFVELAEKLKADDAEERFEKAIGAIIKAKPQKLKKPKD